MRTPPDHLDASDLTAVLAVEWGLTGVELAYAPVGFGAHHWWASVAGRRAWFVTAHRADPRLDPAFRTAAALRDAGLDFVVAPVTSELGDVAVQFGGFAVSVTPWIADATDHPAHGDDVAELLAALHGATDSVRWVAGSDDLAVEARAALEQALAQLDDPWSDGPYAEDLRRALATAAPRVRDALADHDHRVAAVDRGGFVVTHGEVKPGNLLATVGGVALVDWDTALLAPRERDLWRLPEADLARYTARSGRVVDAGVLTLYRHRWDLTDTALYVEQLRAAPARIDDTEIAWQAVRDLLQP
ncbi:phosphotransferase [Jatrophihabitans sp. YIM 134969]